MALRRWRDRETASEPALHPLTPDALAVLRNLPLEWLVAGEHDRVIEVSNHVADYGLLRRGGITQPVLGDMIDATRRDGERRTRELGIGGAEAGVPPRTIRASTSRLDAVHVLLMIEDVSAATRVDAMRRDFIANVSHELKTPVGALLLLADAVRSAHDDPEALDRFIQRIETEAKRMSALIADLTDLSELQATNVTDRAVDFAVADAVLEAMDAVHLVAQSKRIDLLCEAEPQVRLHADRELVVTAIRNLLTNGIMYSPSFTKVVVDAGVEGDQVWISVRDEGIGIEPEQQARIFERFYRVDPARSRVTGGTGLGLAIVKHVCVAHGGDVEVQSIAGKGSTFTLRFPAGAGE